LPLLAKGRQDQFQVEDHRRVGLAHLVEAFSKFGASKRACPESFACTPYAWSISRICAVQELA
jgi:hypothetical protein